MAACAVPLAPTKRVGAFPFLRAPSREREVAGYKETLNLPKTDFPMKADLVRREPERLQHWENVKLYEQIEASRKDAPLFVLHDGPPFANGDVHMGTALNKVLQAMIVKSRTMLGL